MENKIFLKYLNYPKESKRKEREEQQQKQKDGEYSKSKYLDLNTR